MKNAKHKIGRTDRTHLEAVEVSDGGIKLAVLDKEEVLLGFVYVGQTPDGYTVHRVEKWTPRIGVDLAVHVVRLLTVERFRRTLSAG